MNTESKPTTENEMLRFIRKHLLPGPNHIQFYWGASATVRMCEDGAVTWFTLKGPIGVSLKDIYWHLRQELAKEKRALPRKKKPVSNVTWDPEIRELYLISAWRLSRLKP